jgi:hypothetical protein
MHTKINIHQNDPNFLTHVKWSKTILGMQHIHLELWWNLTYAITKENKNNSIINISDKYKIVINSPEVCFGTKRQYEEVCCKNLIIFVYKNHWWGFCRNGKQFLEKYLHHKFVQFFCTGSSHDITHNIFKNWAQRIYRVWDIADIGFLHFYFSCKNYQELTQARITKVVGFFAMNPTKLSLHFSDFSVILYAIYKNRQITYTI